MYNQSRWKSVRNNNKRFEWSPIHILIYFENLALSSKINQHIFTDSCNGRFQHSLYLPLGSKCKLVGAICPKKSETLAQYIATMTQHWGAHTFSKLLPPPSSCSAWCARCLAYLVSVFLLLCWIRLLPVPIATLHSFKAPFHLKTALWRDILEYKNLELKKK